MKIRFNGMFQITKKGCIPCGHRVTSGKTFLTSKSFILPSGMTQYFHIGEEYEVSDVDGNFLLSYSQTDKDGIRQDAFTRID